MTDELKPCPFCGGKPKRMQRPNGTPMYDYSGELCFVMCSECAATTAQFTAQTTGVARNVAMGRIHKQQHVADLAWNKRTSKS